MKFNSILIAFCLFQVLICSTIGLNEKSLQDAAANTLRYVKAYHQESINLKNKDSLIDLKFNYPALTTNNVLFKIDEYGLLTVKYANIKASITGKYNYKYQFWKSKVDFTAHLNNLNWEVTYLSSIKDLGNGKTEIHFKINKESKINCNLMKLAAPKLKENDKTIQEIKYKLKDIDLTPLKSELRKITQLILDTLNSYLK